MMDNEKIINKIIALLNKTVENGASKEEAIAASLMAQRLMKKYKISKIVNTTKAQDVIRHNIKIQNKKWIYFLAQIVARNFCCTAIREKHINIATKRSASTIKFYGYEKDVQIVTKMFHTLCMIIERGAKKQIQISKLKYGTAKGVQNVYTFSFLKAAEDALSEQCRALQLVIPNEVHLMVAKDFPPVKTKNINIGVKHCNPNALYDAKKQGEKDGREATERKKVQ